MLLVEEIFSVSKWLVYISTSKFKKESTPLDIYILLDWIQLMHIAHFSQVTSLITVRHTLLLTRQNSVVNL